MSSEAPVVAPKKRGRPRKVVAPVEEGAEVEVPIKQTKTKSTTSKTTTTRTRKPKAVPKMEEVSEIAQPIPVEEAAAAVLPKTESAPIASGTETKSPRGKSTVTAKTSKILEQVRELSTTATTQKSSKASSTTKSSSPAPQSTIPKPSEVPSKNTTPVDSLRIKTPPPAPERVPSTAQPPPNPSPIPTSTNPSISKPKVPLAAFNSAIVSNISERAGARPNTAGSKALPKGYQSAARKVTMTIVALPIAIVTSYVLYQRLVLGEQKQLLLTPRGPDDGRSTKDDVTKSE